MTSVTLNSNVSLQCYHHGGPLFETFENIFLSIHLLVAIKWMQSLHFTYSLSELEVISCLHETKPLDKLLHPMHSLELIFLVHCFLNS